MKSFVFTSRLIFFFLLVTVLALLRALGFILVLVLPPLVAFRTSVLFRLCLIASSILLVVCIVLDKIHINSFVKIVCYGLQETKVWL